MSICEVCHHATSNLKNHLKWAHPGCARPWMAGVCGTLIGKYYKVSNFFIRTKPSGFKKCIICKLEDIHKTIFPNWGWCASLTRKGRKNGKGAQNVVVDSYCPWATPSPPPCSLCAGRKLGGGVRFAHTKNLRNFGKRLPRPTTPKLEYIYLRIKIFNKNEEWSVKTALHLLQTRSIWHCCWHL